MELAYQPPAQVVDLTFTPNSELELTRSHLTVLSPEGEEVDADEFYEMSPAIGQWEDADLLVAESTVAPEAAYKKKKKETLIAIGSTVAVHILLFIVSA